MSPVCNEGKDIESELDSQNTNPKKFYCPVEKKSYNVSCTFCIDCQKLKGKTNL